MAVNAQITEKDLVPVKSVKLTKFWLILSISVTLDVSTFQAFAHLFETILIYWNQ